MTSTDTQRITLMERIRTLTEEVIEDDSYFLVDIVSRGFKGSRSIELFVDGDTGVNVDILAGISRRLGFLIDSEEVITGKYTLTVSSPGNKYDFLLPRQYAKHVGKKLDLHVDGNETGKETESVRGTLQSVSDNSLVLIVSDEKKREIKINSITKAKVVLPW